MGLMNCPTANEFYFVTLTLITFNEGFMVMVTLCSVEISLAKKNYCTLRISLETSILNFFFSSVQIRFYRRRMKILTKL